MRETFSPSGCDHSPEWDARPASSSGSLGDGRATTFLDDVAKVRDIFSALTGRKGRRTRCPHTAYLSADGLDIRVGTSGSP